MRFKYDCFNKFYDWSNWKINISGYIQIWYNLPDQFKENSACTKIWSFSTNFIGTNLEGGEVSLFIFVFVDEKGLSIIDFEMFWNPRLNPWSSSLDKSKKESGTSAIKIK